MVNVPNPSYDLKWTPIFQWCMVGCESKSGHQKDMLEKEKKIGLCAQNFVNYPKRTSQRN